MSPEVLRIVGDTLHDPAQITVSPTTKPIDAIEQSIYPVGGKDKTDLLLHLIDEHNLERILVFTRTKHRADRVARVLDRAGIRGAAIHGNRSQAQRQKALDSFKRGHVKVLVATDVVSRGIDIDDITHVVNFDLPNTPEDYVHRIGRTARAGRSGTRSRFSPPRSTRTCAISSARSARSSCVRTPRASDTRTLAWFRTRSARRLPRSSSVPPPAAAERVAWAAAPGATGAQAARAQAPATTRRLGGCSPSNAISAPAVARPRWGAYLRWWWARMDSNHRPHGYQPCFPRQLSAAGI